MESNNEQVPTSEVLVMIWNALQECRKETKEKITQVSQENDAKIIKLTQVLQESCKDAQNNKQEML